MPTEYAKKLLAPGPRTGPQTPEEQSLADLFNALIKQKEILDYQNETKDWDLNSMPLPSSPPGFRSHTTMAPVNLHGPREQWQQNFTSNPDPWEHFKRIVPAADGLSPRVQYGPTPAIIPELLRDMGEIRTLEGTNVLGVTDNKDQQVGLQLGMGAEKTAETMAHEMGHVVGRDHGPTIKKLEALGKAAAPRSTQPPGPTLQETLLELVQKLGKKGMKVQVK